MGITAGILRTTSTQVIRATPHLLATHRTRAIRIILEATISTTPEATPHIPTINTTTVVLGPAVIPVALGTTTMEEVVLGTIPATQTIPETVVPTAHTATAMGEATITILATTIKRISEH